jgi:hypothetical protein
VTLFELQAGVELEFKDEFGLGLVAEVGVGAGAETETEAALEV